MFDVQSIICKKNFSFFFQDTCFTQPFFCTFFRFEATLNSVPIECAWIHWGIFVGNVFFCAVIWWKIRLYKRNKSLKWKPYKICYFLCVFCGRAREEKMLEANNVHLRVRQIFFTMNVVFAEFFLHISHSNRMEDGQR